MAAAEYLDALEAGHYVNWIGAHLALGGREARQRQRWVLHPQAQQRLPV